MTDLERAAYYADTGDYEGSFLYLTRRLHCGHIVSASEDSGGMDELPRVTLGMVELLLNWKIETHNCERFDRAVRVRAEGRPFG